MTEFIDSRMLNRAMLLVFAVLAVSVLFATPVAADNHATGQQIICGGNEQVETVFRYMVGLFMAFGFTFGMLLWAAEKFEVSVLGGQFDILGGIHGEGKEALKAGVLMPVVVYFFDFIDVALFGIEITCIVPKP